MGKLIGESFEDFVADQITIRQKKLGQINRDNDLLSYLTSKNPWIRLTSSVDINQEKSTEIGLTATGAGPARDYQLQGGVIRGMTGPDSNRYEPRGGIIKTYTDNPTQAYGFDTTAEYGIVPIPSVESFEITPKNNGSLQIAKVKVRCFNKQQFEKIESFYLRLGYTLLLEWGHSVYFNNDGTLESNPQNKLVSNAFLSPSKPKPLEEVLDLIKETKEDSSGNYDAMVGRVTNFEWSVTPDGHYETTISVTSTGDVIESLSISNPLPSEEQEEEGDEPPDYKENVMSTPIGRIIQAFKDNLNDDAEDKNSLGPRKEQNGNIGVDRVKYYDGSSLTNGNIKKAAGLKITGYEANPSLYPVANKEIIRVDTQFASDDYYFIKFGALLRIIQNFLLIYDPSHERAPIVNIDWGYASNPCYIPVPTLFSPDPRILIIPSLYSGKRGVFDGISANYLLGGTLGYTAIAAKSAINLIKGDYNFKECNFNIGTDFIKNANNSTFEFMHIHLNMDFVIKSLTDNVDGENKIGLLAFVQSICDGINTTLSNLVELEPFHDKDTNTLYIVNKANSDKLIEPKKEVSRFRVGLLPQGSTEGSFVKEVSINSTIPANFATQIAIGAQANDNEITSNSTVFSKWNEGLKDRITPEKQTSASSEEIAEREASDKAALDKEANKYQSLIQAANSSSQNINRFRFKDSLFNLDSAVKEYFKLLANKAEKENIAITPMVLPISLNITMDGLSGIKIFQKYSITEDFLPSNYTDALEFIVKGVTHTIDKDGWTSKIEGQCIPKLRVTTP